VGQFIHLALSNKDFTSKLETEPLLTFLLRYFSGRKAFDVFTICLSKAIPISGGNPTSCL